MLLGRLQAKLLIDVGEDATAHLVVLLEELLGVLTPLTKPLVAVGEPGTGLLYHVVLNTDIQEAPFFGDTLTVHDVELDHLERWRHLVLNDLDPRLVAHRVVAGLQGPDAPDIEPYTRVELQRPAARRRLGRSEHHPDLLPQLVDEDGRRPRTVQRTRKLPESLTHQAGLKPHMRVAHLTFDFSPRHQCGDRVDHDYVEGAAADESIRYLQGLFAVV